MKNLKYMFLVLIFLSCVNKSEEYEINKISRILDIGTVSPTKICSEDSFSSFNGDGHAIFRYKLKKMVVQNFKNKLKNSTDSIFPYLQEKFSNNWKANRWKRDYSSNEDLKVIEFIEAYINNTEEFKFCPLDLKQDNKEKIFSYLIKKSNQNIIGLEFYLIDEEVNTITICEIYL